MNKGIVAYTAERQETGVLFTRSYAGEVDRYHTDNFRDATLFLTNDFGNALHIVWDLQDFADTLFTLLPGAIVKQLDNKPKVNYQDCKIFYVPRWLGLTTTRHMEKNFYGKFENNFFGISHWIPEEWNNEYDALSLASRGEAIIAGLNKMDIYPDRLTSPVGVFSQKLKDLDLPVVNEDNREAANYCQNMMGYEWRSAYKVGYSDKAYVYDLTGAYPFFIADLPNTDKAKIVHSKTWVKSDWGIMRGKVRITADVSPIVYATDDGYINPKGEWEGYFTTEEIKWLYNRNAGRFTLYDGYFFTWLSNEKPYREVVNNLYSERQTDDEMVQNLAKKTSQGISGKLDQRNKDGSLGELYNPIMAAITRSRCRIAVADFIYDNDLLDDLVAVQLDGVIASKPVILTQGNGLGNWRLDAETPVLILGKGEIWRTGKKPMGLTFEEVMTAIEEKPEATYYRFGDKDVDLKYKALDTDRIYDNFPKSGVEVLAGMTGSKAIIKGGK